MNKIFKGLIYTTLCVSIGFANAKDDGEATKYTKKINKKVYKELNFKNKKSYEDADRGFIAPLIDGGQIKGIADIKGMQFVQNKKAPNTVNPSLWRHAQLVNRGGLYEVLKDKIYQVRGHDLANVTIIEAPEGLVFYDLGYSPEALEQAVKLYFQHRPKKDIKAIIISHSHADHYGGIDGFYKGGFIDKKDIESGKIPVYVPKGMVEEAANENIRFGNIMARRAAYQYGNLLLKSPTGVVTSALGPLVPNGANSFPSKVKEVPGLDTTINIAGLDFEFIYTPDTEAPAEMVMYIPEYKAVSLAENVTHMQHNVYTMRGAKIRDAKAWGKYLHEALIKWGSKSEVFFAPHSWPVWGNDNVVKLISNQRDLYKGIADQTARLANMGMRPRDIVKNFSLPKEILDPWENRPYYGDMANNIIATYVFNLGWFNANPTELAKHTDEDSGKRFIEAFGEKKILKQAKKYYKKGDYRFTVELLSHIVSAKANNKKANELMAKAFEQLGYQEETALTRNWYLTAAKELRSDKVLEQNLSTVSQEAIEAVAPDEIIDTLATFIIPENSVKAGRIALVMKLNGESYGIEIENGVMNSYKDYTPKGSKGEVQMSTLEFVGLVTGKIKLKDIKGDKGGKESLKKAEKVFDFNRPHKFNLVKINK